MAQFDSDPAGQPSSDVFQLVVEHIEEFAVSVLEEVRERPGVAAAMIAGVIGALAGLAFAAARSRRDRRPAPIRGAASTFAAWASALDLEEKSGRVSRVANKSAKKANERSRGLFDDLAGLRSAADLVPLTGKVLENPLVRAYLRNIIRNQVRRRFGR